MDAIVDFIMSLKHHPQALGFTFGALFGAFLFWGGLADPDKIVGMLRLKDFHALRTILMFLLVGMLGTWILGEMDLAKFVIKPALMVAVPLGGAIFGIGIGLTGYCPGTGLACAIAGRIDALVAVIGMLVGALIYVLLYPWLAPLDDMANLGWKMIPEVAPLVGRGQLNRVLWVMIVAGLFIAAIMLTRLRKAQAESEDVEQQPTPAETSPE